MGKGRGHRQTDCTTPEASLSSGLRLVTKLSKRKINCFPRMYDLHRSQVGEWRRGKASSSHTEQLGRLVHSYRGFVLPFIPSSWYSPVTSSSLESYTINTQNGDRRRTAWSEPAAVTNLPAATSVVAILAAASSILSLAMCPRNLGYWSQAQNYQTQAKA